MKNGKFFGLGFIIFAMVLAIIMLFPNINELSMNDLVMVIIFVGGGICLSIDDIGKGE